MYSRAHSAVVVWRSWHRRASRCKSAARPVRVDSVGTFCYRHHMVSSTLVFAFIDLAGYTALTEAHGDDGAADCAQRFYRIARSSLTGGTRIVKRIGDAVMLVGADVPMCAESVMKLFAAADAEPGFPALRAGIYAGPAVEQDGDFFGATVNLAARAAAHARAGETLCGASVAESLKNRTSTRVVSLGSVALKNVSHAVELFSVLPAAERRHDAAVDPVCRMAIAVPRVELTHEGRTYYFCSDACAERFQATPNLFVQMLATM